MSDVVARCEVCGVPRYVYPDTALPLLCSEACREERECRERAAREVYQRTWDLRELVRQAGLELGHWERAVEAAQACLEKVERRRDHWERVLRAAQAELEGLGGADEPPPPSTDDDVGGGWPEGLEDVPVRDLPFTVRTANLLVRHGLTSARSVFERSREDLAQLHGFGRAALDEVDEIRSTMTGGGASKH